MSFTNRYRCFFLVICRFSLVIVEILKKCLLLVVSDGGGIMRVNSCVDDVSWVDMVNASLLVRSCYLVCVCVRSGW